LTYFRPYFPCPKHLRIGGFSGFLAHGNGLLLLGDQSLGYYGSDPAG